MDHGACSPVHGAADKICRGQNKMGKRAYTISETFISDTLQERERNLEKLAAEYFRILEKRLVHTGA